MKRSFSSLSLLTFLVFFWGSCTSIGAELDEGTEFLNRSIRFTWLGEVQLVAGTKSYGVELEEGGYVIDFVQEKGTLWTGEVELKLLTPNYDANTCSKEINNPELPPCPTGDEYSEESITPLSFYTSPYEVSGENVRLKSVDSDCLNESCILSNYATFESHVGVLETFKVTTNIQDSTFLDLNGIPLHKDTELYRVHFQMASAGKLGIRLKK